MARLINLHNSILKKLAKDISLFWPRGFEHRDNRLLSDESSIEISKAALCESFEIWTISENKILTLKNEDRLISLATQTHRYHHQIKHKNAQTVSHFALSSKHADETHLLNAVFFSPIAGKTDDEIAWLDENEHHVNEISKDPLIRLLIVPSYHMHLFWLDDGIIDHLLLIQKPDNALNMLNRRLYDLLEFREIFIVANSLDNNDNIVINDDYRKKLIVRPRTPSKISLTYPIIEDS